MNGTDFITLAGKLAASTGSDLDEARDRTAASRAYYGAFHEVSSLLREWEVTVRRNAYGHQDAYDQLWQSGHELARKVAGLLGDLRPATQSNPGRFTDWNTRVFKTRSWQRPASSWPMT